MDAGPAGRRLRAATAFAAPLLVAAALVLGKYADTGAHWSFAVRPVLVAMAGAGLLQLILLTLRQTPLRSAAVTTVLLLILGGGRSGLVLVGASLVVALAFAVRRRTVPSLRPQTALVLAAAFLGASLIRIVVLGTVAPADFGSPARAAAVTGTPGPSIYLLVLDAYGRQDTLATMGFDNEPFLGELERRGFDTHRDSRSNYTWTASTMASLLNLRPLHEIERLPPPGSPDRLQLRELRRAINDADGLRQLRALGYSVVSMPPLADYVVLQAADAVLDHGRLTEFEVHLLQDTALATVLEPILPGLIGGQHRDRVAAAFADLGPRPNPSFVLAHVISPHQPFVFDAAGGPVPMPDCFPGCWFWEPWDEFSPEAFAEGYLAQLQYVNDQTLAAVDRVIAGDPGAVMAIISDHGTRAFPDDAGEPFRNFMAVRTPGQPGLLGDAPTPVNLLGAIFRTYLGIDAPRWPDDQYAGRHLDAVRIEPADGG